MKHKLKAMSKAGAVGVALVAVTSGVCAAEDATTNWLNNTISPVCNPIYFEDPHITSEVRPIYMYQALPDTFEYDGGKKVPLGGQVQVTALQLRYALTDRLALIATKDGYVEFQPDNVLAHQYGFADLAAGLKYALIDDLDDQFILTPGFTVTVPIGGTGVYQGHGSGVENIFVSAEKGFDALHVTGNLGFDIPNDFSQQTAQLHYSLQVDYYLNQYFIPFVAANGYTILSNGGSQADQSLKAVPLNTEGYDLINFGSSDASGTTQFTIGGGFRTRILQNVDAGVAFEAGVVNPVGIFDTRITADVIWRF